ncbi:5-formyltetrahydrofolate cyclo-ligase [Fodinicola feengrottensis]
MTHSTAKRTLRAELLAARRERPEAARGADSAHIIAALTAGLSHLGVRTVAGYAPIGSEPGQPLPDALLAAGFRVLLPVVRADNDLDWANYRAPTDLAAAGRGLVEPVGRRLGVDAVAGVGAVVVPAVAVGRDGGRLGRGGGSYDRSLPRVPAGVPIVALTYDNELMDVVPTEPHDQRITAVVTPSGGWLTLPAATAEPRSG